MAQHANGIRSGLTFNARKRAVKWPVRLATRHDVFLAEMDKVVPWSELCVVIEPFYPKARSEGGRPCHFDLREEAILSPHPHTPGSPLNRKRAPQPTASCYTKPCPTTT